MSSAKVVRLTLMSVDHVVAISNFSRVFESFPIAVAPFAGALGAVSGLTCPKALPPWL